ncbi:MAG TPA: hypothetical protein VFE32_20355 [Puia sp.]|nr:hypothetical protein [Puia sp.]
MTLHGSATDGQGMVVAWLWSEVSGPNVAVIQTEGSPSTTISGLTTGVWVDECILHHQGRKFVGSCHYDVGKPARAGYGRAGTYSADQSIVS